MAAVFEEAQRGVAGMRAAERKPVLQEWIRAHEHKSIYIRARGTVPLQHFSQCEQRFATLFAEEVHVGVQLNRKRAAFRSR